MLSRRRRRKEGQVVKVDLGERKYALAIVLREPLISFFDREFSELDGSMRIDNLPTAFTLMVMNNAVTSGRWEVIGHEEVPERLRVPPKFCKKDDISGNLSIYHEIENLSPHYERPAHPGECEGLEPAAVWEAKHVEDRLRDYFARRPNEWVEQLKFG